MREGADKKLEKILDSAARELKASVDSSSGFVLYPLDVAKMLTGSQTKTLRDKLVTQLADEAENDLLKIYNNQNDLPLGDAHDAEQQ